MKTPKEIIDRQFPKIATLTSSEPTQLEATPSPSSPPEESEMNEKPKPERIKPLETVWQRKWLDLEVTHPDVQALATCANEFGRQWFLNDDKRRLLVIVGKTGCGKTHVARRLAGWASAVAYERWLRLRVENALPEVRFHDWCNLANGQRTEEKEFCEWMHEVCDVSLLILDDVGIETDVFKSGIPTARLCELLNYRAGKFTIITTNVPANAWASRWDARVEDRLLRDSVVFEMAAPSYTIAQP